MSARLTRAMTFVSDAFKGKTRTGTSIPYVVHLVAAMEIVGRYNATEDEMIIALLHDYLEDIEGAEPWVLEELFGTRVAESVLMLTDSRAGEKEPWKERKERYINRLAGAPESVRLVCAADKIHNARSILADYNLIGEGVWDKFQTPKTELLRYYFRVLGVLGDGWEHPILGELAVEVEKLKDVVHGKSGSDVEGDGRESRSVSTMR